jgi:hypothetical protein
MVDGVLFKDGIAQIYTHCKVCHAQFVIHAHEDGYKQWANGKARIQDAMPQLNEDNRELLISNVCGECWEKVM